MKPQALNNLRTESPAPSRTDLDWDLINRVSKSHAQSFTAPDAGAKPQAINNLIREHLTPEWALYQGRTYRILRIMDGIVYLDHAFGAYAVKLSDVEVY